MFKIGEYVEIVDGPYKGLTGHIIDRAVEKGLLKIYNLGNYWWAREEEARIICINDRVVNQHLPYSTLYKKRIKKVIFNDPATIILWNDGTKTIVKAEGEPYDPEKGMAMAIAKKYLGNKGNYYEEFKKWLPEEPKKHSLQSNLTIKKHELSDFLGSEAVSNELHNEA